MLKLWLVAGAAYISIVPLRTEVSHTQSRLNPVLSDAQSKFTEPILETFHCQTCYDYLTTAGPVAHYFLPGQQASVTGLPGARFAEYVETLDTPVSRDDLAELTSSSSLVSTLSSLFSEDDESGQFHRMDCHSFNACHEDPPGQWNFCGQNHNFCGGASSEVVAAVLEAKKSHSLAAMNGLAAKYPRFVRVVAERNVVLLISCTGELVRQESFTRSIAAE